MKNITKNAIIDSLLAAGYVTLVGNFFYYAENFFGGKEDTVLAPISMLLLLVISAGITGSLVFGRSILWYLDGNRKEAINLLIAKFISLFVLFLLFLLTPYIISL